MNLEEFTKRYNELYTKYDDLEKQLNIVDEELSMLEIDQCDLKIFNGKYISFTKRSPLFGDPINILLKVFETASSVSGKNIDFIGKGYYIDHNSVKEISNTSIAVSKLDEIKILTQTEFIDAVKQASNEFKTRFIKEFIDESNTI